MVLSGGGGKDSLGLSRQHRKRKKREAGERIASVGLRMACHAAELNIASARDSVFHFFASSARGGNPAHIGGGSDDEKKG